MSRGLLLSEVNGKSRTTLAVRAEELGYESVWLGELWGASSPVQLAGGTPSTSAD